MTFNYGEPISVELSEYLKDYLPNGIRLKKVEMPWSRMFEVLPILED